MNYFITDYGVEKLPGSTGVVLEDSIMHKGRPVTAGSKILENYISPLDATVVSRIEAAGMTILGKTKMPEFGVAGLFTDAEYGMRNAELSRAVSAVEDGVAEIALCNDYTGATGAQAAAHGLYYIRPTYGAVSRYGLVHAVPSMDQIGIVCKTPEEGFRILDIIAGHDPKDGAMYTNQEIGIRNPESGNCGKLRIGVPTNVNVTDQIPQTANRTPQSSDASFIGIGFNAPGFDIEMVEFELKYFDVFDQIMQILCSAELSNNITRYDGIKFGYRASGFKDLHELYTMTRTEALGEEAKLAAMLGAMVLSHDNYTLYYDKAMKIRRLIKESLDFDKYDMIAMPAFNARARYTLALNALPQLCGLPAVIMPLGGSGVTLIAGARCEHILFSFFRSGKS